MALENEHVFNGRYRADTRLGTGGMAIVYCGTDLLLRRRVAIKVLRDQYASDDDFVQRFSYEAQSAAKLSHPNIVSVYDFGREDDAYFIVMELVDGETLADMVRGNRTIPEPVAIDYATQIAAGLAYAHRQGLLHRDIKPANILITTDDVVKISDFGIARAVAENAVGVTQPGMVMGSVAYVSPEQAQGHELDARSDLYSLGVVLFQMIAGRLPFSGETPVAVALKHVTEPAPALDPGELGISPALASIIGTLLAKDPAERFASATELGRVLREAREQPAVTVPGRAAASGEAPTAAFARIPPMQPPPRRSLAPDVPRGNGPGVVTPPARASYDLRWLPLAAALFVLAVLAGYAAVTALGPRKNISVDDFTNRSATQAQQALVAAGLRPDVKLEPSDTVPLDRVIRQEPVAGSKVARDAVITLFVSSGMPMVDLPDVKGFTRADAERALANAKFRTKTVLKYDNAPKDTVIAVAPGGRARAGSTIVLTVSQGHAPARVPQLVGLTVDAARAALAKAGLKLNVDQQTADDLIPKDTIVSQTIAADSTADAGSTIGVNVSSGAVPVAVPDMSGKSPADAAATLQAAGFTSRLQYIVDATNASGTVSSQEPAPGANAPRHSTVTISVAVPGTVPDVGGMTLEAAKAAILGSGYAIGNLATTEDGDEGKVARTEPEANANLRPGESVTIYFHPVRK